MDRELLIKIEIKIYLYFIVKKEKELNTENCVYLKPKINRVKLKNK